LSRIGILGGSFNPPHLGHLICAQEAYLELALERVLLVPVQIPPHKVLEEEPGPEHRLELCRLATAGDEQRLAVSDLEIRRDGPSYTVDTLEQLHAQAPDNELFLIVGGDVAAGFPSWREPERVLSLATLAVAERRGTPRKQVEDALCHLSGGERARFFRMPTIGISSTVIRRRAAAGAPLKYLVPDAVAEYIDHHSLYRGSSQR
jgi:nicotinate-nucleotide adenylyltransferase